MNFTDEGESLSSYELPPISEEQRAVVDSIAKHNIIVDSVAGSGKTTTVLYVAKTYPEKSILLLTYNAKLRLETRHKAQLLGLTNIYTSVHTYHSFGVKYISKNCHTDAGLIKYTTEVCNSTQPNEDFEQYDLVIVDECQDMTPVYYKLVRNILLQSPDSTLSIIGDKYQSIYGYAGSDPRFITHADKIYNRSGWKKLNLSTSYRITNQMAAFVNGVLGSERLRAVKEGPLVRYSVYNAFKPDDALREIQDLLKTYKPCDIFILAPSVRSKNDKNPVKKLSNALSNSGIKVYMPMDDDSKLDDQVIAGKLVFSSFHQAKGLERKAVIVLGFDESYFQLYNRSDPKTVCNNVLYVALTRASEYLSVYQGKQMPPFRFLDMKIIKLITDFRGKLAKISRLDDIKITHYSVTELTRHISAMALVDYMKLITITKLRDKSKCISLPIKTSQTDDLGDSHYEEVSDINGTAIPAYYEYRKYGWITIFGGDIGVPLTTATLLENTNKYLATRDKVIFKVNQIRKYDWLSEDLLRAAYQRTCDELDGCEELDFEKPVSIMSLGVEINGCIDAICTDRIIEFKAVTEIKPEHLIQTILYGYMHEAAGEDPKPCHLFNVRTNELLEVKCSDPERLLRSLVCKKIHTQQKLSTAKFLQNIGVNCEDEECEECAAMLK